ncbi:MAG: hypothetical protein JXA44_08025 [Methanospirillaceae archaeon]|nr:hypothetical protein [Methanospirillaceae archaeon]
MRKKPEIIGYYDEITSHYHISYLLSLKRTSSPGITTDPTISQPGTDDIRERISHVQLV